MKWVKYLQRTPFAQIRADWTEYMKLRRQYASAQEASNVAYNRIITVENGDKNVLREKSCVRHYYCSNNYALGGHCCNSSDTDNIVWVRYSECKLFDDRKDGAKCSKTDCPFVTLNHEYADARARLNVMRRARRDFWRAKFVQACQKVK